MSGRIISRPFIIAVGAAAALSVAGGYAWHETHRPKVLELYVLDLPGGLGLFIRTPNDKRVLVNGGSNAEVIRHLTDILPFYSRRIDIIMAANPDGKHTAGLIDVLDRYLVDEAVMPAVTSDSLATTSPDPVHRVFIETVDRHNVPVRKVTAGDTIVLDTFGSNSVRLNVLFPAPADQFKYSKASGPEIVMRIDYGSTSVVFMGSVNMKVQKFIAQHHMVPSDIMIFSHSALPANISGELIRAFAPDRIVYSRPIAKTSSKGAAKKGKAQIDSLAGILDDRRFNVKKTGVIKIMSDGSQTRIGQS